LAVQAMHLVGGGVSLSINVHHAVADDHSL
jgi:hypothetical protein